MLNRRKSLPVVLIITLVRAFSFDAPAVAKNWNTTNGNWGTAANWSPATVPVAGEDVNIVNADGVARTVTLDVNTPSLGLVTINQTGGSAFNTLSIPSNNTFTSSALFVGGWTGGAFGSPTSGRGAVSQSNGTVTMASGTDLGVANGTGSTGTYTLNGGAFVANQSEFIGYSGTGTFTQSGGTNTLNASAVGYLNIGTTAGALGTYNLSGDPLVVALVANKNEVVGDAGTGIFNQTGGTNTIQGAGHDLQLGNAATGNGTYTISGGTLTVGNNAAVGVSGTGTMTIQNTGSVYITNTLSINSTSNVNLSGGTLRFSDVSGIDRLSFNSGTVQLAGLRTIGSSATVSSLFGSSIPSNRGLTVEGNAYISSTSGTLYSFFVNGSLTSLSTLQVGGAGDGNLFADGHIASQDGIVGPNAPNQNSTMTVSGPGASWTLNDSLTIGAATKGTLTIQDQGLVYVGNQLTITNQGVVNFFNGTFRFDTYSRAAGGLFNFYAGTIQLEGSRTIGTDPAITDLFGVTPTLTAGKGLTIEFPTTLLTTLLIDGGTFTTPSVAAGGQNLQLRRGTLNLTSQSVTIGSGGLLGSALDLPSDMTVNVTGGITNQGLVTGDGQIGGTFTNAAAGELRGEPGRSLKLTGANNVNAGQINLFGGMVEFTQNLTNNNGAFISGNGTLKVGTLLTNSGTMNFSGLAISSST
jgi:T5SS/PEP-CTERM-associated repeat protein